MFDHLFIIAVLFLYNYMLDIQDTNFPTEAICSIFIILAVNCNINVCILFSFFIQQSQTRTYNNGPVQLAIDWIKYNVPFEKNPRTEMLT